MISAEPVNAEIPVTVNASRTTQGVRVHEETRTVSILPDGAVVRLSAKLPPGELVVLTNGQNGLRVVCRVKYTKQPPESADCVDLEFIMPTPGFWNESPEKQEKSAAVPGAAGEGGGMSAVQSQNSHAQSVDAANLSGDAPGSPSGSARMPIWRQGREVLEVKLPLAEPAAFASASLAPLANEPGAAALVSGRYPMAAGVADIVRESDDADGGSFAARMARHAGTKIGALVIVAAISIANGAVIGAWFQRLWTRADAPPQVAAQQGGPSVMGAPMGAQLAPVAGAASVPDARGSVTAGGVAGLAPPPARREVAPDGERPSPAIAATPEANIPRSALNIGEMPAPVRKKALTVVAQASDAPVIADEGRSLSQVGTAVVLLTGVGAKPAPPVPPMGGQLVPLKLISSPAAVYPVSARSQGIEGVVTLDVLVDATGKVTETTVILGNPLLQSAARAAVLGWKYQPARLNGEAIPMRTKVTVRFSLH